jgi:hypothetical protein
MRPRARTRGLIVRKLGDEVVVYDEERHLAHCLNRTAALVFHHADGSRSLLELAGLLARETSTAPDPGTVRAALARLAQAGLLENADAALVRRDVLRQVGRGAALLVPVVSSLLVPTPAEAAATCVQQTNCQANDDRPCSISNSPVECVSYRCQGAGICAP